ncbi:uncharacterized protein MKZ38_007828 [Zalerion maritima]|uniref:Uncharacterized protein n=1 Tax=Zalerion maritima TaxID=339359 RepID=A0AAD5RHQ3_9PEZI|nr:uncharacterized protein MKZ38_007828 [Zalerion maritima]
MNLLQSVGDFKDFKVLTTGEEVEPRQLPADWANSKKSSRKLRLCISLRQQPRSSSQLANTASLPRFVAAARQATQPLTMATASSFSRTSQTCLGCLRANILKPPVSTSTTTLQIRGKKNYRPKGSMRDGVVVRLTQDIEEYGPKVANHSSPPSPLYIGALLRVARGRYRNIWYPRYKARALTPQEFKASGMREDDIATRDPNYVAPTREERIALRVAERSSPSSSSSSSSDKVESLISKLLPTKLQADVDAQQQQQTRQASGGVSVTKLPDSKLGLHTLTPEETILLLQQEVPGEFKFVRKLKEEQKVVSKKGSAADSSTSSSSSSSSSASASSSAEATAEEPRPKREKPVARNPLLSRHAESASISSSSSSSLEEEYEEGAEPAQPQEEMPSPPPKQARPEPTAEKPIFGSVTPSNVLSSIREILASSPNPGAKHVRLSPGDLSFVAPSNKKGDATKLQQTGTFAVEISIPGADGVVQKVVRIVSEEEGEEEEEEEEQTKKMKMKKKEKKKKTEFMDAGGFVSSNNSAGDTTSSGAEGGEDNAGR